MAIVGSFRGASGAGIHGGRFRLPSWRRAMTAGTFAQVGGNTLADINPENSALYNPNYGGAAPWRGVSGLSGLLNYSGAAWDEANLELLVWGGGHTDYAGNEVYRIALNTDLPLFIMERAPTGAVGNTGVLDDGLEATENVYFDNRPRSVHTGNSLLVVNGDMWCGSGCSMYKSGRGANGLYRYSRALKDWDVVYQSGLAYTGMPYYGSATARDPNTGRIWCVGAQRIGYFDTGDMAWHDVMPVGGPLGGYSVAYYWMAWEPTTQQLLIFRDNTQAWLFHPVAHVWTLLTFTGTAPTGNWGRIGVAYDEVAGHYLIWENGASFITLTLPSNPLTQPWVWGSLAADPSNTVTPSAAHSQGSFGRFFVSKRLGIAGMLNAVNQKIYVFALR